MVASYPMEPISIPARTTAQKMIDAAICAYSINPNGYSPPPFFSDPLKWVNGPHARTAGPDAIDAGLVGITDDGWAVISLRGTLSSYDSFSSFFAFIDDWLQDDETTFVPLRSSKSDHLGEVHKGFHRATMALWPKINAVMAKFDWANLNGLRITGHSKGAGMSFLFAALANAEKSGMRSGGPKAIEVHAFAAPLAGNPEFAAKYSLAGLDKTTTRYQRANDLVPFLAPYVTFDLFEYIDLWNVRFDFELDAALEYLSYTVTRGYQLVGRLEFYPDRVTSWPDPLTGTRGQNHAQAAILSAIQGGYKNEIAAAHSAISSYWPAIFQQDLPNPPPNEVALRFLKSFEAEA